MLDLLVCNYIMAFFLTDYTRSTNLFVGQLNRPAFY